MLSVATRLRGLGERPEEKASLPPLPEVVGMGGPVPPIGMTWWVLDPLVAVVLHHTDFGDRRLIDELRLPGKDGNCGGGVHALVAHGQLLVEQFGPVLGIDGASEPEIGLVMGDAVEFLRG